MNPTRQVLVKDFTFEGFSRLRFLNLGRLTEGVNVETLLRPLASLTALDLSGIQLQDVVFLTQWKDSLVSLVLYNMDLSEEHIQVIAQLRKLRSAATSLLACSLLAGCSEPLKTPRIMRLEGISRDL